MKKLMFVAAVTAAMTGVCDVQSQNIVGFTTVTVPADKWQMVALPFEKVGEGGAVDLQDLVKGIPTALNVSGAYTKWGDTVPQLQLQNRDKTTGAITAGNTTYYYVNATRTAAYGGGKEPGWANQGGLYVGKSAIAAVSVKPGTAYWFKIPATETYAEKQYTVSLAGQVVGNDAPTTITVPQGKWQMVCNPFPMDIPLNSVNFAIDAEAINVSGAYTKWGDTVPQLQLQNRDKTTGIITAGNTTYYYVNATRTAAYGGGKEPGWANQGGLYVGKSAIAAVTIPAGAGFWFKNPNADTVITFTR